MAGGGSPPVGKIKKGGFSMVKIWKLLLIFAFAAHAAGAAPMAPGGIEKKYIGLFFDILETTPSNILAHADDFARHAPYLDGLAIALDGLTVEKGDGTTGSSKHTTIMHPSERWTRSTLKKEIEVLKAISQKPHLSESFLLFWMSPGYKANRLSWTDDKAWANYAENMANVAWLAKKSGMKGLMLDHEDYSKSSQYYHTPNDPPFDECARLARQRGREVFSRIFEEYPDAVIFFLSFFKEFGGMLDWGHETNPAGRADELGMLLPYFYNGVLDVVPPGVKLVDGAEHYQASATKRQFLLDAVRQTSGALAFVAPENWAKYRSQWHISNTHYFDMYVKDSLPRGSWYHEPVNGSRLEHLRLNLEESLFASTKYVWLYGEVNGKLFNWRDGTYEKKRTWEEAIPGITETLMLAKDPRGLGEMRKRELAAKGELVNLAADVKPFAVERPPTVSDYTSVGNRKYAFSLPVKPGERYFVSVTLSVRKEDYSPARAGAAQPRVVWKNGGKRVKTDVVNIPVPDPNSVKSQKAEAVVTVPEGVDEMEIDRAASIMAREVVGYENVVVYSLVDADLGETAGDKLKWVYDPKTRKLTDGNWNLTAVLKEGTLRVLGDGAKTVGSGVLDFSNVKNDTGYPVSFVGRFNGHQGITAFVAPDVNSAAERTFSGCANLKKIAVGEFPARKNSVSEIDKRRDMLIHLGLFKANWPHAKSLCYTRESTGRFGRDNLIRKRDVKPGELYLVGLSMKRTGSGEARFSVNFRGTNREDTIKWCFPAARTFTMDGPRKDGVWRSGSIVVRVPEKATEIFLNLGVLMNEGTDKFEFDKFELYKIGDPLPKWPAEYERTRAMYIEELKKGKK